MLMSERGYLHTALFFTIPPVFADLLHYNLYFNLACQNKESDWFEVSAFTPFDFPNLEEFEYVESSISDASFLSSWVPSECDY